MLISGETPRYEMSLLYLHCLQKAFIVFGSKILKAEGKYSDEGVRIHRVDGAFTARRFIETQHRYTKLLCNLPVAGYLQLYWFVLLSL